MTDQGQAHNESSTDHRPSYLVIAMVAIVTQIFLSKAYYVGMFNDDACYLTRAFQFTGASTISEEILRANQAATYAPGWPLLLSPLTFVFGDNLESYRILPLLFLVLSACLFYRLIAPLTGRITALIGTFGLLLSNVVLTFGTTLFAEPLFAFLTLLLIWYHRKANEPKLAVICSIVTFAMLTRTEGYALLLAVVVSALMKRRWRDALLRTGLTLVLFIPLRALLRESAFHESLIGDFWKNADLVEYLPLWVGRQSESLSKAVFGGSNLPLKAIVLVLCLISIWGSYKWWKAEQNCGPIFVLTMPGVLLLWPYFDYRYFFAVVPLWTICLLYATPAHYRARGLTILVLIQVGSSALFWHRSPIDPELELYRSIRTTPQEAKVVCLYNCRVALQGRRMPIQIGSFRSLTELTIFCSRQSADYVVWLKNTNLLSGPLVNQMTAPPELVLKLNRSELFSTVVQTQAGVVAKLAIDPSTFDKAFQLYVEAAKSSNDEERFRLLTNCLSMVPEFSEAKLAWIHLGLTTGKLKQNEALAELKPFCARYPHEEGVLPLFIGLLPDLELLNLLDAQIADARILKNTPRLSRLLQLQAALKGRVEGQNGK